jgi:hypothetical protein
MYMHNEAINTPSDETRVWRYMNLSSFLSLISSKRLYFSRLAELRRKDGGSDPDTWEAFLAPSYHHSLQTMFEGTNIPSDIPVRLVTGMISRAAVSCWHRNEHESIAMWKLYTAGKDGVAISTTMGNLKKALSTCAEDVFLGSVSYVDYFRDMPNEDRWGLVPVFRKRTSYAHEQEVRAAIISPDWASASELLKESSRAGVAVEVDTSVLIEHIVLSPDYPHWGIGALERIIGDAGLKPDIMAKSDLLKEPEACSEVTSQQ